MQTKKNRDIILNNLQKLTNDKLVYNDKTGEVSIDKTAGKQGDKDLPNGTKLIAEIINHQRTTTIDLASGENVYSRTDTKGEYKEGVASNAAITFVENNDVKIKTLKNGLLTLTDHYSHIGLGHELIHSLAMMNGNTMKGRTERNYFLDPSDRKIIDFYNSLLPTLSYPPTRLTISPNKYVSEYVSNEELATTGVSGFISNRINENSLRKEQGYESRDEY